ncbi:MAG: hypothetical protein ACRDJW_10310 [Thermomicrobiales bacterium]
MIRVSVKNDAGFLEGTCVVAIAEDGRAYQACDNQPAVDANQIGDPNQAVGVIDILVLSAGRYQVGETSPPPGCDRIIDTYWVEAKQGGASVVLDHDC